MNGAAHARRVAPAVLLPLLSGAFAEFVLPRSGPIVAVAVLGGVLVPWVSRRFQWLEDRIEQQRTDVLAAAEDAVAMPAIVALTGGHLGHSSWAFSPGALLRVLNLVEMRKHEVIVECGSGVSTVVFAEYLRKRGVGHVYAIEHDAEWAAHVHQQLALRHLETYATVLHAPLEAVPDDTGRQWYAARALTQILALPRIDVLLVDGPPKWSGATSRGRALEVLGRQVAVGGSVILDDAKRPGEREVVRTWRARPGWTFDEWKTSHGQVVLTRNSSESHNPAPL